jgi:hypothetical protein
MNETMDERIMPAFLFTDTSVMKNETTAAVILNTNKADVEKKTLMR